MVPNCFDDHGPSDATTVNRGLIDLEIQMTFARIQQPWLMAGLVWFLVGIAWVPSNKLYQQGLVVFLWLPAAFFAWQSRDRLRRVWIENRIGVLALAALLSWALVSLSWSAASDPVREAKRVIYALLFVLGLALIDDVQRGRLVLLLQVAGFALAAAALISMVNFYGIRGESWAARLSGSGQLHHPILGGYVMGMAAVWMFVIMPRDGRRRLLWAVALVSMTTFMILTQSRGVWLALLGTVALLPAWRPGPISWGVNVALILAAVLGYFFFEPIVLARGASYRPEITWAALSMLAENPLRGVGLGADYEIAVPEVKLVFDHSHNVFTHVGIELGLPGLLLWLMVWGNVGRSVWIKRKSVIGGAVLAMWVYATQALLFDGASLLDSPRAEWILTWFPVGLWLTLAGNEPRVRQRNCDKGSSGRYAVN